MILAIPVATICSIRSLDWLRESRRAFPGFFVMDNGIVPTVGLPRWTGMAGGMPFTARILAVDGQPVRSSAEIYARVASRPVGTPVDYSIDVDGQAETRRIPSMTFELQDYLFTLGLFVLNGWIGLLAGFAVNMLRPRDPAARGFMLYGFFWGLFPLTGITLYDPSLSWLSPAYWIAQTVFPATFLHFGLVFPVERPIVRRHRWILALPYAVSLALLAWIRTSYFADPPSWAPLRATFLYSSLSMVGFLGLLGLSWMENRAPMVRPRLRMVLPGFAIGAASAIYGFLQNGISGGFPINLIALTPIVFFAALAWAIVAHDAFEIDRVLRMAAVYVALSVVIAAGYAAIAAVGSHVLPGRELVGSLAFDIPVFVLFGLLLQPLRLVLQRVVDATFFRSRVDYGRAVGDTSAALTSLLDPAEIVTQVGNTVADGLSLENFAAVAWPDGKACAWHLDRVSRTAIPDPAERDLTTLRRIVAEAGTEPFSLVDAEDDGEAAASHVAAEVAEFSPSLVVPIPGHDGPIGAFLLGAKRSGLPFGSGDYELLRTLAAQAGIALRHATSFRSLRELAASLEDRVRERTLELERSHAEVSRAYRELHATQRQLVQSEKLASLGQLVAGVAHEINNPVSFIVGNLDPLRTRLRAIGESKAAASDPELGRQVERLLGIIDTIGRGAERTARIVQDLRVFSRSGDTERAPFDVHEGLEVSIRLLQSKWESRIAIERDYGRLPMVEAVPGHLNQVFMNLLSNACDAIEGTGTIRVRTLKDGDHVEIYVTDDGRGIEPSAMNRIFDPFFTTKPQGQGTGLGLAITHGIVEDHGGTIDVESRPGRGTTFRVRLPIRPSVAAPASEPPAVPS
jgi:signal transduction histidine kinase